VRLYRCLILGLLLMVGSSIHHAVAQEDNWFVMNPTDPFGRSERWVVNRISGEWSDRYRTRNTTFEIVIRARDMVLRVEGGHMCHTAYNPAQVSVQADRGRVLDSRATAVTDKSEGVFLNAAAQRLVASAKELLVVQVKDFCGNSGSATFATGGLEPLLAQVRPAAQPRRPSNSTSNR
jgi:hypothetical protein